MNNDQKLYAGIDLHKKYAYVTIMDNLGYIKSSGRFENSDNSLVPTLLSLNLNSNTPVTAVVESTYGWYWLGNALENAKISYVLAHPKKINAIVGRKKTDKEDSKALADLLRTNLLPTSYIPTQTERSTKELLRFRAHLVSQQTEIRNRLRDILAKHNLESKYSNILCIGSRQDLAKLSEKLNHPYDKEIESLLAHAAWLKVEIDKFTDEAILLVKDNPDVKLLLTIPGVGELTAAILVSEIGDINRFKDERSLASYAGLVPSVSSSGGKTHLGATSSYGNPYIRTALAEGIYHLIRKDPKYKSFYERLSESKGKPKAKVAVMNKLLRVIYVILTKKVPFQIENT